jgi:SAM-dependent methyltransferase
MNRERKLWGINSYQKELGIDFLGYLAGRARGGKEVRWMDLCCGMGNALIQAADQLHADGRLESIHLEGLDLVGMFADVPAHLKENVHLQVGSVFDWQPGEAYDLITCVHGIHYLGDKLGLLRKALGSLKEDGLLVANLDVANFKDANGKPLVDWWKRQWKQKGWKYHARRHLLEVKGRQEWTAKWEYLGADDQAGPNYSGQPVVDSYYRANLT